MGPYGSIRVHTGPYRSIRVHTGPYGKNKKKVNKNVSGRPDSNEQDLTPKVSNKPICLLPVYSVFMDVSQGLPRHRRGSENSKNLFVLNIRFFCYNN